MSLLDKKCCCYTLYCMCITQENIISIQSIFLEYSAIRKNNQASARLGISEHRMQNNNTFGFKLDDADYSQIREVTSQANDLFESIGDCGDEYR